jgi:hypothetical protein
MAVDPKTPAPQPAEAARNALRGYLNAGACRRLWCFADSGRRWLAEAFAGAGLEMGLAPSLVVLPGQGHPDTGLGTLKDLLAALTDTDLLVSMFSLESSRDLPHTRLFPSLSGPPGFRGTSGAVRRRCDDGALLTQLMTDPAGVEAIVRERLLLNEAGRVRIVATGGTDLACELMRGRALPYRVCGEEKHAYLPPSEVTFGILPGSAEGTIVTDVTAGEFVVRQQGVLDPLGLVDEPIRLTVRGGRVADVAGGIIAGRLRSCFDMLDGNARTVVELGFGLSAGAPTGQVGSDECLQGTFHFGIGDDSFYGGVNPAPVHLDLISWSAEVEVLQER